MSAGNNKESTSMLSPAVSVCIPTYNYGNYIAQAIDSVLAQTYTDFELIIIDDHSSDNTAEIVEQYLVRDNRIKFYINKTNLGMVENWNRCLDKATGTYVKLMGADDMLEPACLEKSVKILDENPQVTLISGLRLLVDEHATPIRTVAYSNKSEFLAGVDVIKKCFFTGNLIGEPAAVLFRNKDSQRGFNPSYRQLTDLEMWFSLLEKGDFAFIPDRVCKFRVHQKQTTKVNVRSLTFISDEILLHRDYIGKKYMDNAFMSEQRWKFKYCYTIWTHKYVGLDIHIIRSEIRPYIPLYVFYPLLSLKLAIEQTIAIVGKIASKAFGLIK